MQRAMKLPLMGKENGRGMLTANDGFVYKIERDNQNAPLSLFEA